MNATRLILVGGFLGAGKTTLLCEAARRLVRSGRRVGLITNDQAPDLVDSQLLSIQGFNVQEVAGSCFCCNFQGLLDAAGKLLGDNGADILIGEPVGSCTDLSATILQPIKARHGREFDLAPLSVLVDPQRLEEILTNTPGDLHPSAAYIVYKQLEEADWIVVNKLDLITPPQRERLAGLIAEKLPGRQVYWLSAQTGEGVDAWLNDAVTAKDAGRRVVDVDYDTYAEGEAVLGWLNATVEVTAGDAGMGGSSLATALMEHLKGEFSARGARIGHVKILLAAGADHLVANLTRSGGPIIYRGRVDSSVRSAQLTINARVEMSPEELEDIVRDALERFSRDGLTLRPRQIRCLSPGRPQPTFRMLEVV